MTTEDEMVGWHPQHEGHEFEKAPGIGDGQGGLECCSPWGHKESDMTEWLHWSDNKVLGTLGKRTILKAKEGLGAQDAGANGKAAGWGPLWPPWPEMVWFYWSRQPDAGRPGDVSDTETPGSVMPHLLRDREDGGSPSCGLGDGEAIFSKKRQKPKLFLQTCRGKWGSSPTCWARGVSVLIQAGKLGGRCLTESFPVSADDVPIN